MTQYKFQHLTIVSHETHTREVSILIDPWTPEFIADVLADDPFIAIEARDCTPEEIETFIADGGVEDALERDAAFDQGWDNAKIQS